MDIQFGGVRLLLMPSVTPYSCPTLITNRMVLEVLLEHNLLSCQLREEDFFKPLTAWLLPVGKEITVSTLCWGRWGAKPVSENSKTDTGMGDFW